jgi:mono/diheme cytochrome c family protein
MANYHEEHVPIPTPWRLVRELRLKRPPWWMVLMLIMAVVGTWVPLALIYKARRENSRLPRVHFFHDMDHQAKFSPQDPHPWFRDGRAMRLPIEGTIARGGLQHNQHFALGYFTLDGTRTSSVKEFATTLPAEMGPDSNQDRSWLLKRGADRYAIYCGVCHGPRGAGDGPVNRRALELQEAKWVPATNLMTQMVRDRADGQLFQAISDGVRNMPSYGGRMPARDRWAVVFYLRAMQAQQPVAPDPQPRATVPAQPEPPKS